MTDRDLTIFVTQRMQDLHLETARQITQRWGIPADEISNVIACSTFGLGLTMMVEGGHSEDQIIEIVHDIVTDLEASPDVRGAS